MTGPVLRSHGERLFFDYSIKAPGSSVASWCSSRMRSTSAGSRAIGTPLAVGKVVGKVIRHFEDGFAVRFNEMQNLERLEEMIVYNWPHEAPSGATCSRAQTG
jgi:hypothetical protein